MKWPLSVMALTVGCLAGSAGAARAQGSAIPTDGLELWVRADGPMQMASGQISQWSDLSANANHAVHDAFGQATPTLGTANGKPTLHFSGAYTGFHFNKITTVRTVFAVLSKDSTSCLPTLPNYGTPAKFWLGGNDNPTYFHPEHGCAIYNMNLSEVSPNLVNGKTYVNGMLVDGRTTRFPFELGLLSIVSLDNVSADTIGRDRNFNDRSWQGNISELIIYSKPLDDATRQSVQTVLATKYSLPGGNAAGGSGSGGGGGAGSGGNGGNIADGGSTAGSAGAAMSGAQANGGTSSGGTSSGGASSGGTVNSAGSSPASAGTGGAPTTNAGTPASGGTSADVPAANPDDANGCSCRAAGCGSADRTSLLALLMLASGVRLRRRTAR